MNQDLSKLAEAILIEKRALSSLRERIGWQERPIFSSHLHHVSPFLKHEIQLKEARIKQLEAQYQNALKAGDKT